MNEFHNRTRTSTDIPERLRAEGKGHLVWLYRLLEKSHLASEGIKNSGSYEFADHIYKRQHKGTGVLGVSLDWLLLRLPSARAFRYRYLSAEREIEKLLAEHSSPNIIYIPSGLAREGHKSIADTDHGKHYFFDLDGEVFKQLPKSVQEDKKTEFIQADIFEAARYPNEITFAISMGIAEFISDEKLIDFLKNIKGKLAEDGRIFVSAMLPHKLSDYLMREFAELHTSYRSPEKMVELGQAAGLKVKVQYTDATGLQTITIFEDANT